MLLFTLISTALCAVTVLDAGNFDALVNGNTPAIIKFYAPWCGHCKSLAPIWEQVGDAFPTGVIVGKIDCDDKNNKGVCSHYDIKGFPTLKFFKKGTFKNKDAVNYDQGRDFDSITTFLTTNTGIQAKKPKVAPTSVLVLDSLSFDPTLSKSKHVLVEFYAPWCGHCKNLAPIYEKVAKIFENEPDCIVSNLDADTHTTIASRYDVKGYPTVKFFKQGQDPIDCNVRDEAGLVEFLNQNCGTHRTLNGGLTASAGRIPELDAVVAKFLKSPSQKFVDEIKNAAKNVQGKYKDYYGKAMEKVLKDGNYLSKEIQRLEKLIGADGVIPEKLDDFISRKNILSLFAGDAPQVEL